jgi:diguanylate cyclase (GGDEF)-like protein/PAS domain S-box-containing protein
MKHAIAPTKIPEDEDQLTAGILLKLIWASGMSHLMWTVNGLFMQDWPQTTLTISGFMIMFVLFILVRRGYLRISRLIFVFSSLSGASILATEGQGIRDLVIVAFPIIFVFAGLTLNRTLFHFTVVLTMVSVLWLALGEIFGLFIVKPMSGEYSKWFYLFGAIIMLLIGAVAVDMLAVNFRKNLALARQELSQRIQTEETLRISEERFKLSMDATRDGLWDWNIQTGSGYFSPGYYRMLGFEPNDFSADSDIWRQLIHPEDKALALQANTDCIEGRREQFEVEYRMKDKNGGWHWILGRGKCISRDANGRAQRLVGTHVDITERKLAEAEIFKQKSLLATVIESASEAIYAKDLEGKYFILNEPAAQIFNIPAAQVTGRTDFELLPEETARGFRINDQDAMATGQVQIIEEIGQVEGQTVFFLAHKTPWRDHSGNIIGVIGVSSDITDRKAIEERLRYQGTHDHLTGIYNRSFFEAELARLEHSREFPISIIMGDVDGLKIVNDSQGHAAGDELLRNVANILSTVFRESEVLARVGGDEFAALLPATNAQATDKMLERVKERLANHNTNHPETPIHISLGAAVAATGNLVDTFKLADQRMYTNKAQYKKNLKSAAAG